MPPEFPTAKLAAAEAAEAFQRNAAFLNLTEFIEGVEVLPLTLRHIVTLEATHSPFMVGGKPNANDVVNFLWLLNRKFEPNQLAKRWFYLRRCRKLDFCKTVKAIANYIDDAFSDGSGKSSPKRTQYYSTAAGAVDLISAEYGWSEDTVLDLPVKRVIQYSKAIALRTNPKAVLFNRSREILVDYIHERDAWLATQGKE